MSDITASLLENVTSLVARDEKGFGKVPEIINSLISGDSDIEQVITFLDESPSEAFRRYANVLREAFVLALERKLVEVETELKETPFHLYTALIDMYNVSKLPESLAGILTINYDEYIEKAIAANDRPIDFGVSVVQDEIEGEAIKLIKLHGSFGWQDVFPILRSKGDAPLWIPPGIQKAKERYPFNFLWGLARELLSCDVVRIIGVGLGENDWDLISLLFTTRFATLDRDPFTIEVIDEPKVVMALQNRFPYLDVRSVLELDRVGKELVGEIMAGPPREYSDLNEDERSDVLRKADARENWFRSWLIRKAEAFNYDLGSIHTTLGAFEALA